MPPTQGARRRHRTFTGCWKCRLRKVKCDEERPWCLNCRRMGIQCSGYEYKLVWTEKDQKDPIQTDGRRILRSESTWAGFKTLSSELLDLLILSCDQDSSCTETHSNHKLSSWTPRCHSPFSVFSSGPDCLKPPIRSFNTTHLGALQPPSLDLITSPLRDERFLFHHYVNHVASLMLPYEHPHNPWQCHWATAALNLALSGQKFLYRAILAHSAFNIAHLLGSDANMFNIALQYYNAALSHLKHDLGHNKIDSSAMLASIMSLIFAEAYGGHSTDWKHHLRGARTLLQLGNEASSWILSDLARSSRESLGVIEIIAGSSTWHSRSNLDANHQSSNAGNPDPIGMLSTPDFIFTIGAPRRILECIAKITHFSHIAPGDRAQITTNELLHEVLSRLNSVQNGSSFIPDSPLEAKHQARAFVSATYIYSYRTLLDVPPHAIQQHVHNTLSHVSDFLTNSSGNFSAWPAFIAAAEAYTEEDLATAQKWLDWATSLGIGSRTSIKVVLHEIWRRRKVISQQSGLDPGKVTLDWKQVMHELGCDSLLI